MKQLNTLFSCDFFCINFPLHLHHTPQPALVIEWDTQEDDNDNLQDDGQNNIHIMKVMPNGDKVELAESDNVNVRTGGSRTGKRKIEDCCWPHEFMYG